MILAATLLVATLFWSAVEPPPAEAASAACRKLEAQLAALKPGRASGSDGRYGRAAEAQRREIARTRSIQRRAGCGFLGSGGPQCADLSSTLRRMEANLGRIEARAGGGRGDAGMRRERARLNEAIAARGCREERPAALPRILTQGFDYFRESRAVEDVPDRDADRRGAPRVRTLRQLRENREGPRRTGAYRTLCVRTCDGYFFPMSFGVGARDFAADQAKCEAACPGSEVRLYSRKAVADGETDADMISATGEPYKALPTAFRFRQDGYRRPESCGCNAVAGAPKGFSIIAGETTADIGEQQASLPLPYARPDPSADPETLLNRDGGLTPDAIRRLLRGSTGEAGLGDGGRKVRVVGPVFLPDPEGAIDLRAPAPTADR